MDLICHGVASPLLFKKYISWLGEKKSHQSLTMIFVINDMDGGWIICLSTVKSPSVNLVL